ncbi:MAG: beta-carotene 15,15'-dioxygenase, Brp/Blh family [Flavobacteriales bacterium]
MNFDYIFCGVGASASLVLFELDQRAKLEGKAVLLLDPHWSKRVDKTFCFWARKDDRILEDLSPFICHRWTAIHNSDGSRVSIEPWGYYHVSSQLLRQKVEELAKEYGWTVIESPIDNIEQTSEGPVITVDHMAFRGRHIFDSRPPVYLAPEAGQTHLLQSFEGWEIETETHVFDQKSFRFMDFHVAQGAFTQFIYVLPFAPGRALVELTRFGSEIISSSEAAPVLEQYIASEYGKFTIVNKEYGCIPMSNCSMQNNSLQGVTPLGGRAGRIKASTGYAFRNMYDQARHIAGQLEDDPHIAAFIPLQKPKNWGRFPFYDALLLDILDRNPAAGKGIFTALLSRVSMERIFTFLDEKTSIREEVSLFLKLPAAPFLRSLGRRMWHSRLTPSVGLLLVTAVMLILQNAGWLYPAAVHGLLLAGLIAVGIPHGAVDHLVESGSGEISKLPRFILQYIATGALMGLTWLIAPVLGLIAFLIYSAWHFGQADGSSWRMSPLLSLSWGASVICYILGTHPHETNAILASMGGLSIPGACPWWSLLPWALYALSKRHLPLLFTLLWLTLASQLPLLLSFSLYFIGQHSLVSWNHLKAYLRLSNRSIWIRSLPFHGAAWVLCALFYLYWPSSLSNDMSQWGTFFIFLACVSFPHVLAMRAVFGSPPKHGTSSSPSLVNNNDNK